MPKWRNRQTRTTQNRVGDPRVGSTPTFGTNTFLKQRLPCDGYHDKLITGCVSRLISYNRAIRAKDKSLKQVRIVGRWHRLTPPLSVYIRYNTAFQLVQIH